MCKLPCDVRSFEIIDYRYSKDKNNVFFPGFTIKGAHAASFKVLNSGYATDKNAVYFQAEKISDINPAASANQPKPIC